MQNTQWSRLEAMMALLSPAARHGTGALARLMRTLDELPKPTIARGQGAAFGGGVGLVACCDIAIASTSARFGLTESRLGLLPAVAGEVRCIRLDQRNVVVAVPATAAPAVFTKLAAGGATKAGTAAWQLAMIRAGLRLNLLAGVLLPLLLAPLTEKAETVPDGLLLRQLLQQRAAGSTAGFSL